MNSPLITQKEEWTAFFDAMFPQWTDYLRSKGTNVDSIETYNPADYSEFAERVKSLPARYSYQGVRKTVLVPVELLSRDAYKAAEEAKGATEDTRKATEEANKATQTANTAATNADNARKDLEDIKAKTTEATDNANRAANDAMLATAEASAKMAEFAQAEEQRNEAEASREQAFSEALAQFLEKSGGDMAQYEEFYTLAVQSWNEFVSSYEARQTEIDEAEEQRKANEVQRQGAEQIREQKTEEALKDAKGATDRLNTLADNPPKIQGNPATWWFYDETSKTYIDSKKPASSYSPYIDENSLEWKVWDDSEQMYKDSGVSAFPFNIPSENFVAELMKEWDEEETLTETNDLKEA